MSGIRNIAFAAVLACLVRVPLAAAQGGSATALPYGATYREICTWQEQAFTTQGAADRTELWRESIRARYGLRGLRRLFSNLEGRGAIDLTISGVEKNLRLTLSDNANVRKGARRTYLYATRIHNHPSFQLLAVDEPTMTSLGATDKDIVFRDRASGQKIRVEVKDVKIASQRADIRRLKSQIDKMAVEFKQTGEIGAIVNRQRMLPSLAEYARSRGVIVYDRVATGKQANSARGLLNINDVLADMHSRAVTATRTRIMSGAGQAGFGILLLYDAVPQTWGLLAKWRTQGLLARNDRLRLGQSGSTVVSGAGMVVSGGSKLAQPLANSERLAGRLRAVGRAGGWIAAGAFLAAEGFIIAEWRGGGMSTRQFVTTQAGMGGGLAGGLAGAWAGAEAGALVGAWFGPWGPTIGGTIGGIIGGISGSFGGAHAGQAAAGMYYGFRDAEQEQRLQNYIYSYYGSN